MTAYLSLDAIRRHKVVSHSGAALGRVDDLIFDPQDGKVRYLILAAGGLLGVGDKRFAVPFADAQIDLEAERLVLRYEQDDIANAPGFIRGELPDFAPAYRKDIDGFYAARKDAAKSG